MRALLSERCSGTRSGALVALLFVASGKCVTITVPLLKASERP